MLRGEGAEWDHTTIREYIWAAWGIRVRVYADMPARDRPARDALADHVAPAKSVQRGEQRGGQAHQAASGGV